MVIFLFLSIKFSWCHSDISFTSLASGHDKVRITRNSQCIEHSQISLYGILLWISIPTHNKYHRYWTQMDDLKWHQFRWNRIEPKWITCYIVCLLLSLIFIWLSPIMKKKGNTYIPWLANKQFHRKTCVFKLFGNCSPLLWHNKYTPNYRIVSDRNCLTSSWLCFVSIVVWITKFLFFILHGNKLFQTINELPWELLN